MAGQAPGQTFQRWPLVIEASFLILLVLSFTTRRLWPALILIGIGYFVSAFFHQWFILSPVLALLIAYFIFFGKRSGSSPEISQEDKKEEGEITPHQAKKNGHRKPSRKQRK